MTPFVSNYALFERSAKNYLSNYQPMQTNVVRIEKTDILSLVQSKAHEMVNNSVPNSIARNYKSTDLGMRLDMKAWKN